MPVYARPAQVLLSLFSQFRAKLLKPAIHAGAVHRDAALRQEIDDILIGQRIPQIPTHSAKNDVTWEGVVLERGSAPYA